MKKLFMVFVLVIVALLFVSCGSAAASVDATRTKAVVHAPININAQDEQVPADGEVTLPIDLVGLIKIGVGLLVAQGLKSLSKLLKKDISGWGAVLTASFASSFVFFFNALLSAVPPEAQPFVASALALLVTILASFGLKDTIKGFQS